MCLTLKDPELKWPKEGIGWKIVRQNDKGHVRLNHYPPDGERGKTYRIPRGRWLKAKKVDIRKWNNMTSESELFYKSGFHIYAEYPTGPTRGKAETGDIIEVKYRKAKVSGIQNHYAVLVADEILVPRRKKENDTDSKKSPRKAR